MIASKTENREVKSNRRIWVRAATGAFVLAILLAIIAIPPAQAQTFTLLHEFAGGLDGIQPAEGVAVDTSGNVYGMTQSGGGFNYGVVYRLSPTRQESLLHSFIGSEGLWPNGGLFLDAAGNIYGATGDGGTAEGGQCAHGCGTVFKIDTTGKHTVLYAFKGATDGGLPDGTLIQDAAGNFYGTAIRGGVPGCYVFYGCGVIYKLDTTNKETVLYEFTDGTDGKSPTGLVADAAGNLYGTTYDGGVNGKGCVFKLDTAGNFHLLYSFTGGADSDNPNGHLVLDPEGNLYGTTNSGLFATGFGVVFKLDTAGNLTVLHSFTEVADGEYPQSLVRDASGNLYGVTLGGGTHTGCYYLTCGTVFKLDTSNNKTVIHDFDLTDGQLPNILTMDNAGNLYGTTLGGGNAQKICSYYKGCGVVFKVTL